MLTVACVLSEGPRRSYYRSHVDRLKQMVAAHLDQSYYFVCLDDSPYPGWWAKISLFEPGRFSGRVLYLDLDVDVVRSLDSLVSSSTPFIICPDWIPTRWEDGSLRRSRYNSSVMVWNAGAVDFVYEQFTPDVMNRLRGDQDWIGEVVPNAAMFPLGSVVSYKAHVLPRGGVPPNARIVVYHGDPKPWDLEK